MATFLLSATEPGALEGKWGLGRYSAGGSVVPTSRAGTEAKR